MLSVIATGFTPTVKDSIPKNAIDSAGVVFAEKVQTMIADPHSFWSDLMQQAIHFGLKVVAALLIYLIGAWLIRALKKTMHNAFIRKHTERTLATFITSLVSITLTVLLVIATIGTLGFDTSSFAALLTAGGMAIGMALSGTVQNFSGGVMLLMFRPFKSGDYIKAQGHEGFVTDVTIISTKILTYNNRVVILPNGALFNGTIENYTVQEVVRVAWPISVSYGVDAAKCKQAIEAIMKSDPRILDSTHEMPETKDLSIILHHEKKMVPDPSVVLDKLNSNDITFNAKAWVNVKDYWDVYYTINERFYTELPSLGFKFAYPHLDVNIYNPIRLEK